MRNLVLALSAVSLAIPASMTLPVSGAEAHKSRYAQRHTSRGIVYTGEGRRKVCRHSSGTTGLIAGGAGGAVAGSSLIGGGALGTVAGAVGGALAGRAIDRTLTAKNRCYYR